jgi:PAS domain S-box-containing protein
MCCSASNRNSEANFSGLNSKALIGLHLSDIPGLQNENEMVRGFEKALLTGKPVDLQREVSYNGKIVVIETNIAYHRESETVNGYFLTVCHKNKSEQAAEFPFQAWDSLFATSSEIYACIDKTARVLRLNNNFIGMPPSQWIGQLLMKFIDPEDQPVFQTALERTFNTAELMRLELMIRGRWFSVTINPWVVSNSVEYVVTLFRDITEERKRNKKNQGRMALLNDALARSEEAIFLVHAEGKVAFHNKSAAELISPVPFHIDDLRLQLRNCLLTEDGKKSMTPGQLSIFEVLEGQAPRKERFILKVAGTYVPIESSVQTLEPDGNQIEYVLWTLRNRSKDHARIRGLEKVNEHLDHFVQAAAHDLQSPIANLENLSLLLRKTNSIEQSKILVEQVGQSATQLKDVISSMMELAEARAFEHLKSEEVFFEALMDEVKGTLEGPLLGSGTTVKVDFDQAPQIQYNKALLRSILFNLLSNAVKYKHPDRFPIVSISTVEALDYQDAVWLTVKDNGIGMDLYSVGKNLFKPFYRVKKEGEGKGIGLSLVKSFVERNGGEIRVESMPNEGTQFKILLRSYGENLDALQYTLFESEE